MSMCAIISIAVLIAFIAGMSIFFYGLHQAEKAALKEFNDFWDEERRKIHQRVKGGA